MSTANTAPHRRAMNDVETVAKAIFANRRHHEPVHSWDDLYSDEQVSYRTMAAAAIDSLGITEETAFQYTHNASGKFTIIESDSADVRVARKIAGNTHTLTEVSRLVSPWRPVN